jgi:hypothetical protein
MELSGLAVFLVLRDNCEQRGLVELTANPFASHKKKSTTKQNKQPNKPNTQSLTKNVNLVAKQKTIILLSFVLFKRAIRKSMGCVFMGGGGGPLVRPGKSAPKPQPAFPLSLLDQKKKKKKFSQGREMGFSMWNCVMR